MAEDVAKFLLDVVPMRRFVEVQSERNELRDKYVMAVKTLTAQQPTPEPAPNPFREHPVDRRRIGG